MVLVDMDMPKTCMTCKIQGSCTKHLGWSNHKKSIRKSDKCPIKCELPDVHGIKTGRWIEEDVFDGDVVYRCSECAELFSLTEGNPSDNLYHFRPNCGAKMREVEE